MLLVLLLLWSTGDGQPLRVIGQMKGDSCLCLVNSSTWSFPGPKYEAALQLVEHCEDSLNKLQEMVTDSREKLPGMLYLVQDLKARLEPYQYLNNKGLYSALSLRRLGQELKQLEDDIGLLHIEKWTEATQKLSNEVAQLQEDVQRMHKSDTYNMQTVKEKLRHLKNTAESCRSIPKDFRRNQGHCVSGLITNISSPVVTKISPFGKSYISGSWGKQAQDQSPGQRDSYWVQPLVYKHASGNTLRLYSSYDDFMVSKTYRDAAIAPSQTHKDSNEGPSGVLYGEAFYYHCYQSADVCRYNLTDNAVKRVTLPGNGVGNKFPYCYYDCHPNSDVDIEADETGIWAIYATVGNHGNLVVSRLGWDGQELNVTHTWETRLFKKAASNAFMVCGVLYATRYVDEFSEEVFYAFDTATGREDNTLALPLEKVGKGVASLSYNPTDRHIYMYNDGYLLAYQVLSS